MNRIKNILDYITLSLIQIDGTGDFTFDVPDYRPMRKRALEMLFYDEYMEDEYLMIVVNVTEYLTGTTLTWQHRLRWT